MKLKQTYKETSNVTDLIDFSGLIFFIFEVFHWNLFHTSSTSSNSRAWGTTVKGYDCFGDKLDDGLDAEQDGVKDKKE